MLSKKDFGWGDDPRDGTAKSGGYLWADHVRTLVAGGERNALI